MAFEKRYNYYLVKFEGEKTYWYRSPYGYFRTGQKVIVPVTDNGIWKIGTVTERKQFALRDVPYPINKTKGMVTLSTFPRAL